MHGGHNMPTEVEEMVTCRLTIVIINSTHSFTDIYTESLIYGDGLRGLLDALNDNQRVELM